MSDPLIDRLILAFLAGVLTAWFMDQWENMGP